MKSHILLENVRFYANHGVLEQETCVGNVFVINLRIELDLLDSCLTDSLEDTVSYAAIFELVRDEMKIPSKLLEHVAYRILTRLKREYSQIKEVDIKISKRNPPLGKSSQADYASVRLVD